MTLHGIFLDLPPKQKINFFLFVFGTRQNAALLLLPPRQQVEDAHPSVRRGGSTLTVTAGEQLVAFLNTSILPARAPHGRADCKYGTSRWGILLRRLCMSGITQKNLQKKQYT